MKNRGGDGRDASCFYIKTAIFMRTKRGLRNRAGGSGLLHVTEFKRFYGCYAWGSHGGVLGVLGQQQIFKACMGEKQEELQKSYPGASSSSSRGAAAVMATVETEEAASLVSSANSPIYGNHPPKEQHTGNFDCFEML